MSQRSQRRSTTRVAAEHPRTGPRRRARAAGLVLLWAAACAALAGCEPGAATPAAGGGEASADGGVEREAAYLGDLPALRRHGRLRILVQMGDEGYLARDGSAADYERQLAAAFASETGLEVDWVGVERFEELVPALLEGRGDLIVDNFTITPERQQRLAFSSPLATAREQVVTHVRDTGLARAEQLAGRSLALRASSSFWQSARALAEAHPGLRLEAVDERLDLDALLEGVAAGRFDLTLVDSNWMKAARRWHPDVRVAFDLGRETLIAWAMRPESRALRRAVDGFLSRRHRRASEGRSTDDLAKIRERGVLRALTRNNATTYFIWRGQLLGFEYELLRRFARKQGLRLEMVVPPSRDELFPWLVQGRGDVVAAGITITPERAEREGVRFTRMYNRVREMLVARRDDPIRSIEELAGRSVAVRRSSAYWSTLERLRRDGLALELLRVPEELETEEILQRVASGEYELTVADDHIVRMELAMRHDLRAVAPLGGSVEHGWAVRAGNPELRAALDAFLEREYRGLFYNVTYRKYFPDEQSEAPPRLRRPARDGRLSPWDAIVRRYATRYGFDWRLLVAQMYQESRFDPDARSFAGARGLLQVMPRTAREMGFEELGDPEVGLHAGIRYAAWVRDRFEADLPPPERTWFALAAYNVGYGHVRDARRIARERGWDPDRWFGQVERAMLLKQDPEVYRHTRFGYARGSEPVRYVREIRQRYEAYLQVRDVAWAGDPPLRRDAPGSPAPRPLRPRRSGRGPGRLRRRRPRGAGPRARPH